jgi:hypothetical protein
MVLDLISNFLIQNDKGDNSRHERKIFLKVGVNKFLFISCRTSSMYF